MDFDLNVGNIEWSADLLPLLRDLRTIRETVGFDNAYDSRLFSMLVFSHTNFLLNQNRR